MTVKMRVLFTPTKKKLETVAKIIAQQYEVPADRVDKLPPAYSCDKERIVFLGVTIGDEPVDSIRRFCSELGPIKTANVAIYVDGKEDGAKKLVKTLKDAGTNVFADDILYVKCGLPFMGNVKDEEKAAVLAWADKIMSRLA